MFRNKRDKETYQKILLSSVRVMRTRAGTVPEEERKGWLETREMLWGWNHKEPSLFSILTPSKSFLHTSPTAPHFPASQHILLPSLAVKF